MTAIHSAGMTDTNLFLRRHGDRVYNARRVVKSQRINQYELELKARIDADASNGRHNHNAWRALKEIKRDVLAERLLAAGILIASSGDLGADRDGEQNYRDARLWVGRQLVGDEEAEVEFDAGDWGIDRIIELPIFELDYRGVPTFTTTDDLGDLADWVRWAIATNPFMLPRTEAPEPWRDVTRRNDWAGVALVKDKKSRTVMRRAIKAGKMSLPLEALTALETVPLAINEPILKVALQMAPTDIPDPPQWLAECLARQEKVPQWRIDASKAARQHVKACRKLTSYNLDMTMAEMLVGQPFVTPFHLDFRGRVYASTFFNFQRADHVRGVIQFADGAPVGQPELWGFTSERSRRLEEKKWLMAHVAARADSKTEKPSRLNFEERIAWTERNIQRIRAISDAVRREVVPADIDQIDDPVQFIAACHELVQALDDPTFETRLPLTFDCSCSGLQHISAMTRDEVGARYSNLIPSDAAEDFYRDVGRRADELLTDRWYVNIIDKDAAQPDEPNEWLRQTLTETAGMPAWQAAAELDRRGVATPNGWRSGMVMELRDRLGIKISLKTFATEAERDQFAATVDVIDRGHIDVTIDRAIAKQLIVSYFYGATRKSMTATVAKFLRDQELPTVGASKIADAIYRAVEHEVPQARAVRLFLQRLAWLYAKENKLMHWTTPFGLPVINLADKSKTKRKSKIRHGIRRQTKLAIGDTGKVDKYAARRGVTANYTHSMDAATLHLVAYLMAGLGIGIVPVHNSFGTLAVDAAQLNWTVRDAFALIYERFYPTRHPVTGEEMRVFDHLLSIAAKDLPGVKLPEPPRFGALNVGRIRHSSHACK